MAQTSTLSKFLYWKHTLRLLLLLLFCFAGVYQTYGQGKLPITLHNGPWQTGLPEGWTQNGLGADYNNTNIGTNTTGGSAKFDNAGDRISINVGSIPKEVSFYVRANNTFSTFAGEFVVEEAAVDQNYSTVKFITSADKVGFRQTDHHGFTVGLKPTTRYVRFKYLTQSGSQYMMLDEVVVIAAKPEINLRQGTTNIAHEGAFNFGAKAIGETETLIFTIENLGNYDLNLTGDPKVVLSGANANEFSLDQSATISPILEAQSTTFALTFSPTSEGNKTATISIANDDADESPYTFTITAIGANPGPTIISFTPGEGFVDDIVTITGTNFVDVQDVSFNGVSATFIVNSDTEILAMVPTGATTGPISITTISGTATTTENFIINLPTIVSFTPSEGGIGTIVTITGTNFVDVQDVSFNGVSATFTVNNEGEIVAQVPAGATTGTISVTTLSGTATSAENFVVLAGPTIISFTPGEGFVDDIVTITGTNFVDVQDVSFNGVSATFIVNSDTEILAMVPTGATTGLLSVTTLGGTATSTENFTVLNPTIFLSENSKAIIAEVGTTVTEFYTIRAEYLKDGANITVDISGASQNYLISKTGEDGSFVRSLTYEPGVQMEIQDNWLNETYLYVRYSPTVAGTSSVQILHASEGANTEILTVNGSTPTTPLPVEMIAFKATKQNNGVLLTWATASEQDNDYFEVQMTEDMKSEFKTVGKLNSKVGTTSIRQDYKFDHKGSFAGTRYYRLKQVDFDGTTDYSKVVAVSANEVNLAAEPRVYPNPITPDSKLEFSAAEAGKLNVSVVNMSGTRIQSKSYDIEAGENTIELNLSDNLPTGIYILMTEFNGKTQQVKLLKQ